MNYSAVIVAAGSGTRMHLGYNKAYYLLDDKTVLEHAMSAFLMDRECCQIIVVTDPDDYRRHVSIDDERITVVSGGDSRQHSVEAGVKLVQEAVVMIHDGARPFLSQICLDHIKKAMLQEKAACLMVPSKDTIKVVQNGYIKETLPREQLMHAQTPQAFETKLLRQCMQKAEQDHYQGTDDCSLVERYSDVQIKAVTGDYANIKITTPEDLKK